MKTIEMTEATSTLAEYAKHVSMEPVVVIANGKPVDALVAVDNADIETVSLSTNPDFMSIIERSRSRHKVEGGISSSEMRRRLGVK